MRSGKADAHVAAWAAGADTAHLYISAITIEELEIGVLRAERKNAGQGAIVREWMTVHVLSAFPRRVLRVDAAVARMAASLHVPATRPIRDACVAATATVHGMIVVTRNVADFAQMGVPSLNPWESPLTPRQSPPHQ